MHVNRSTLVYITIVMLTSSWTLSAQEWEIVDVDRGSKPSIAISDRDEIHISYLDESVRNGYVGYATTAADGSPVSYTHLTLPTICSV